MGFTILSEMTFICPCADSTYKMAYSTLPDTHGPYLMFCAYGAEIYVCMTQNIFFLFIDCHFV